MPSWVGTKVRRCIEGGRWTPWPLNTRRGSMVGQRSPMTAPASLPAKIRAALDARPPQGGWKGSDPASIRRKGAETIEVLKAREWDVSRTAFLDVGGADGALLEHLLRETSSPCGVMLEFDDEAARCAHRRAEGLGTGKSMRIFTGDAAHKITPALAEIQRWRNEGTVDGMCVTLYAILHELADRGSGTKDLVGLLSSLLWQMPTVVITREPCVPDALPDEVYLSIGDCAPPLLAELALRIRNEHPTAFPRQPLAMTDRVRMDGRLAIETITKTFYIDDFAYELGERVTSLTSSDLTTTFYAVFGEANVRHENLQSATFDRQWAELRVKLRDPQGREFKPQLHIKLIAHHDARDGPTSDSEAPTAQPTDGSAWPSAERLIGVTVDEARSEPRHVELEDGDWTVGRSQKCSPGLRLSDSRVSRHSVTLHVSQGEVWVSPGPATVKLNDRPLAQKEPFAVGDTLTLAAQFSDDPSLPRILRTG